MKFIKNKYVFITILLFLLIYSSISLVNHYLFRTYALDLGIFNNALYDYAHFRWNVNMIYQPSLPLLSDHFTLLHFFYVPFYWIFGTYTLLIIQIAAILFGGYGAYKYSKIIFNSNTLSNVALVHFFCTWGIFSALSFDYHDNVVGSMFVPWFFLYFHKKNFPIAVVFFTLIIISKENMALWGIFLGLGLFFHHFKDPVLRKFSLLFSLASLIYFVLVLKVIMPALTGGEREYLHLRYSALGSSFSEILKFNITHPLQTLKILVTNHLGDPVADGIKQELFIVILFSGGLALLFKPQYLLMLLPVLGQKLFSDDFGKWGINYQYSIEFTPILTIALLHFVYEIKKLKLRHSVAILFLLSTIYITVAKLDARKSVWYNAVNSRFYSPEHYKREFNVKQMYEDIKMIPSDAKLSASSPLIPHLAFREYIYQFPVILDAEYIAILQFDRYPLTEEELVLKIEELKNSTEWTLLHEQNDLLVFKKSKNN